MSQKCTAVTSIAVFGLCAVTYVAAAGNPLQFINAGRFSRHRTTADPHLKMPVEGIWKSSYDSELNGELNVRESPAIKLTFYNDRLSGRYQDQRAVGKENDSIFTGYVVRGRKPMIFLQQEHDRGYTAIYTGTLTGRNHFVGTYADNTGGSGDWSLDLVSKDDSAAAVTESAPVDRFDEIN